MGLRLRLGGGTATFTIAGVDRTLQLSPGTRIKLTQTTTKYFVVASVAFSTNTTVTVTGGSDYTLANAAITAPNYSYVSNPQGYPGWFNFALTATGWSGTPTVNAVFAVEGRTCTLILNVTGTSNATTAGGTAPITSNAAETLVASFVATNNGSLQSAPGRATINAGGTSIVFSISYGTVGGWTSSGTKTISFLVMAYQI